MIYIHSFQPRAHVCTASRKAASAEFSPLGSAFLDRTLRHCHRCSPASINSLLLLRLWKHDTRGSNVCWRERRVAARIIRQRDRREKGVDAAEIAGSELATGRRKDYEARHLAPHTRAELRAHMWPCGFYREHAGFAAPSLAHVRSPQPLEGEHSPSRSYDPACMRK